MAKLKPLHFVIAAPFAIVALFFFGIYALFWYADTFPRNDIGVFEVAGTDVTIEIWSINDMHHPDQTSCGVKHGDRVSIESHFLFYNGGSDHLLIGQDEPAVVVNGRVPIAKDQFGRVISYDLDSEDIVEYLPEGSK